MAGLTPSRASLAPTGFASFVETVNDTKPCGSGLAREEAITDNAKFGTRDKSRL
jgi:hypothetical protein